MDAKITKERIMQMLSYDWLKFIALAVAAILFWTVAFTVTATKITNTQRFTVFNHSSNATLSTSFYDLMDDCMEDGFSYEVLETEIFDLSGKSDQTNAYYEAHLGAETAHLVFMPYFEGGEAQAFVNYRYTNLITVHEFLTSMKAYVSAYYPNGDYENGELNTAKVASDFRTLIKRNNDKRFKGKNFNAGLLEEYARIQSYADALVQFEEYLDLGLVRLEKMEIQHALKPETVLQEKTDFVINLCPDETEMGNLKNYIYRLEGTANTKTSYNMSVFLCRKEKYSETVYSYESLLFINKLIEASRTDNA